MLFERLRAALRRHWSAPASPRLHVDLSRFLPWTFSRRSRIEQVAGFAFVFEQASRLPQRLLGTILTLISTGQSIVF